MMSAWNYGGPDREFGERIFGKFWREKESKFLVIKR